jgi:nicotinamidase-related amidase
MKSTWVVSLFVFLFFGAAAQQAPESQKMKPALLIIDVQKEYIPMMSKGDQDRAIEMMNWSMWVFRQYNMPVIRIYHKNEEWGFTEESPGFQFHDSLKISQDDAMIVKTYPSAFTKTELDSLLKEKEVNTLFLCGLSSVGCVLATYMDAASHDYKAFMIKDALLSHKQEYTEKIQEIFNALDLETAMYMMDIGLED